MVPTASVHVHIIGRGIVGLAAAFALVERGAQVTLVGPAAASGSATVAAVGSSTLKGNIQASSAFFAVKMRGHAGLEAWLQRLEQASGLAVARNFSGAYEPFYSAKDYAYQRERVFHRQFTGCFGFKVVPEAALSARFASPGAFPSAANGAFHFVRDGWFDPLACLAALEAALRRRGVPFYEAQVLRVQPRLDGGQRIETTAGELAAAETLVAAGVFSNDLLAASGFPGLRQELVEGETLDLPAPDLADLVVKMGKMNLVCHGGLLRVGSTSRRQVKLDDCALAPSGVSELAGLAFKQLGCASAGQPRWGIRGRFKDHQPAIGALKWSDSAQRLWVATGFYKNGLQLAGLFAARLAELILSSHPSTATLSPPFPQPLESI